MARLTPAAPPPKTPFHLQRPSTPNVFSSPISFRACLFRRASSFLDDLCLQTLRRGFRDRLWVLAAVQLHTYYRRAFSDPMLMKYMVRSVDTS